MRPGSKVRSTRSLRTFQGKIAKGGLGTVSSTFRQWGRLYVCIDWDNGDRGVSFAEELEGVNY